MIVSVDMSKLPTATIGKVIYKTAVQSAAARPARRLAKAARKSAVTPCSTAPGMRTQNGVFDRARAVTAPIT